MTIRSWAARIEFVFESLIFGARWILSPTYVVLVVCLFILAIHTLTELVQLFSYFKTSDIFDETKVTLQVLTIVDLVLVINLVLMVVFVGYTNFVSKMHPAKTEDLPPWLDRLDYSGLKLQMLGSIIAIASIKMLRAYVSISDYGVVLPNKASTIGTTTGNGLDSSISYCGWSLFISRSSSAHCLLQS